MTRQHTPRTLAAFCGPERLLDTPGFPIGHLGVSWCGPRRGGTFRLRRTRTGWGPWLPLKPGDPSTSGRRTTLLPAGGAIAYQVSPPPNAEDVRTVAINTTDGPTVAASAATPHGFAVPAESSHVLAAPAESSHVFAAPAADPHGLKIVTRAGWGADESLREGTERASFDIQAITVHHTVTANLDADPAATIRALYFFQTVGEDFGDLGYHLLIDRNGTIYEGRYAGLSKAAQVRNGAHVGGFNAGNIGIALLGDFASSLPTPAARTSLVHLLATLAGSARLDPLANVDYLNPISGATRSVPAISTHRNWSPTACPGDSFTPHFPVLRTAVQHLLQMN